MSKITPCLWFDQDGEDAAEFYRLVWTTDRSYSRNPTVLTKSNGPDFTQTMKLP